ncbi:hypothetical protein Nepgr_024001 [Nepenthes gracilis]|uniref:Uncharacterized protein n=1 Tax=Nepenthes gracilis TaxID=150966 RepID=A0AAD3T201_NEPGR|nr:hypothetical protein Nepgr_024001 [Nepenthes gracilis]
MYSVRTINTINGKTRGPYFEFGSDGMDPMMPFMLLPSKEFRTMVVNLMFLLHTSLVSLGIILGILKIFTEALLELLMTTDPSNRTVLHTAASQGHTEVVNFLLERNNNLATIARNNEKTSLHSAARNGNLEVVEALMSKEPGIAMRIDKKGQTALHMAVKGTEH